MANGKKNSKRSDSNGSTHHTKYFPGNNTRRSVNVDKKGNRSNDHQVDQGTNRKLNVQTGKVTGHDKNVSRPGGIGNWLGFGGNKKK